MLFLNSLIGLDEFCIPSSPVSVEEIVETGIMNGMYERLFAATDTKTELNNCFDEDYNFNTILYARFDKNTTNAGNVDWDMSKISHLLIKRRELHSFDWMTVAVKEIADSKDPTLIGTDYTNSAKTNYEYAIVPFFYGIEGGYDTSEIYSDFNDIFIMDKNEMVHTEFSDNYLDIINHAPSSSVITLNNKYPAIIRNTCANYNTGTFRGNFIAYDEATQDYDTSDKCVTETQRSVIRFLSNGKPKLIKHFDGRTLLVSVDTEISNNADGHYKNRELSFNFTEIGDVLSCRDLYMSGLSDVTEEWW